MLAAVKLWHACVVQRTRHLSSLKENELGALVATLQQPQHQQHDSHLDCLQSLHNIVSLTRLPATTVVSPVDKLRQSSLQARSCCWYQVLAPLRAAQPYVKSGLSAVSWSSSRMSSPSGKSHVVILMSRRVSLLRVCKSGVHVLALTACQHPHSTPFFVLPDA